MKTTTPSRRETAARVPARRPARLAARWLPAVCAAWALARLLGADRLPLLTGTLVPILAFTPYAVPASAAVLVWTAVLRRWRPAAVALAATGALAVAVLPRAVADAPSSAGGPALRVLTANLRLGRADPRTLVDLVRRTRADVLSVQEFTPGAEAGLVRAGLAKALPYKLVAPMRGATGSGLYTRFPLRALSTARNGVTGLKMPHAQMTMPGGLRIELMAVHLARPLNPTGVGQWSRGFGLVPTGDPHGAARVLAGDFNATLDHAALRRLIGSGYLDVAEETGDGLTPTFQKAWWLPPLTLDHVLADSRCAVRRVEVYDLRGSDHRAVFAELRLP